MSIDSSLHRSAALRPLHEEDEDKSWWRSSVIYQIYPKSFRDSTGDGVGDLNGITLGLPDVKDLGVDAVWLSPFYRSPQRDGGYDVADYCDVDPMFGTLEDFDRMMDRSIGLGLRVIIDLVPNHCSTENVLFQEALKSEPGSPLRDLFIFRDGTGPDGSQPPNNWKSHFEGPAWTRTNDKDGNPGQWYLHLFDSSQPDWNWDNPAVHAEFERIMRFWLDRGVSGFRVDVAHALVKKQGLPDWGGRANGKSSEGFPGVDAPMFGQPEVHEIYRNWKRLLDSYPGQRILCAEANVDPLPRMAEWVRPDEMHQAFNFSYLRSGWDAARVREVITTSFEAFDAVGAPTTWVLSNHDIVRAATRFGLTEFGDGVGPEDVQPDERLGLDRARAAFLFMCGLPGGMYLYQGEELGLPDHTMISPEHRQDPSFFRSGGKRIGRDGCRVPLPWSAPAGEAGSYGFSDTGKAWLPQPHSWGLLNRESQNTSADSTLSLYRNGLRLRRHLGLGSGSFEWIEGYPDGVLAYRNKGVTVLSNMGNKWIPLDASEDDAVALSSLGQRRFGGALLPNETVWVRPL